jgi:DNA mismatch endonuclease, patch repair protein
MDASERMRNVRRRHTEPELIVRKALWARGLRYRLHGRGLPGTPDIVFARRHVAVFVHGCFWHRHPGCRHATTPKTNTEFWRGKFAANVERDRRKIEDLARLGWRSIVVWGCETRSPESLEAAVARVEAALGEDGLRAGSIGLR